MTETTYQQRVREAEAAVTAARGALGRDLAAAIAGQTWATQMRDLHDVRALAGFIAQIHAAADRAREARGRGRGRPKKPERPAAKSTPTKTPARATTEAAAAE
jgi:hypothetical protein